MPSTYTSLLRLTLPADGELIGTWGQVVNNGITTLEETAIAGTSNIVLADANRTLTTANGATDEARNMIIAFTGALTAQRDIIVPTSSKIYFVRNATTGGFGLNVKTAAGSGVVVPASTSMLVYCNGTNVVAALTTISGAAQLLLADGTLAAPSLSFVSDPDTGIYKPGVSNMSFVIDGARKGYFDVGRFVVEPSPTASSPSMIIKAGNNAGGAGYTLDMLGSSVGTDQVIVRWLDGGYTTSRFQIVSDSTGATLGTVGALPLAFVTSSVSRMNIDASGNVRVTGPLLASPNFWVGETSGAAGSYGISGGLGAAIVTWGTGSAGGGAMDLYASGQRQVQIQHSGGTVANFHVLAGGISGNRIQFIAAGTDTNVGYQWATKGTGDYAYFGNGGVHLQILCTTTGARWIQIGGASSTTNPTIGTNGGGVNFTVPVYGSGVNVAPAGDSQSHSGAYSALFADNIRFQDWTLAADSRTSEMRWGGGFTTMRVLNDAYNAAVNWIISVGGFGSGVSEVKVNLSNAGSAETAVLRAVRTAASVFNVGIGTGTPGYQLQVANAGQVSTTGTIFDLAATSTQGGGTLYLGDTGNAAGNGGCIMFGAFPTPVANGQHFASIKACITDASGFTAGELFISTKNTSADTGSTRALRITADKRLLDSRDLTLTRDPGGTSPTTASMPVGSIVMGNTAGSINALTTFSAATTNINCQATNSGANQTINFGTWRCCGAVSSTSGNAVYIRTA